MADDRYRDNSAGGGRRRSSSIFPDDETGGRPQSGGGRGFFERARDEVGNWLGGGNDEGGRASPERSRYGQGQSGFGGEHYRSNSSGADWERSGGHGSGSGSGSHSASYAGREQSNTSHFDENYRRWREQQIARLDQEYEDYCRERQQRFETDFHSWREARQAGGGQAPGAEAARAQADERQPWGNELHGDEGSERASRSAILGESGGGAGAPGMHEAGEETAGGGDASGMESSTGSSPDAGAGRQDLY